MNYNKTFVLCGIVTFNPNIQRLKDSVNSVADQVDKIIIIDNGSRNFFEIKSNLSTEIHVIEWRQNRGIAAALKTIMSYAINNNYSWVLTLDQDSIIRRSLVDEYLKYANRNEFVNTAIFTCLRLDRNFNDKINESQNVNVKKVDSCITSASLCDVEKYKAIKGYDETFFIDCVDFDICYQFRDAGYVISRINFVGLLHEVGKGENRRFLFWPIIIYHHNAKRVYTLSRNIILLWKKHPKIFGVSRMIKKQIALFIRIVIYEDDKLNKLKSMTRGVKDGIRQGK